MMTVQSLLENTITTSKNSDINIIHNHDFSKGLHPWHPNCCQAYVESSDSRSSSRGKSTKFGSRYAVVKNRKKDWQGLEQDITSRVSTGSVYMVFARVGVSRTLERFADVKATLRVEHPNLNTEYLSIARRKVSEGCWENLEGPFKLPTISGHNKVVFYIEGPPAGVDLLIEWVVISCSSFSLCDSQRNLSELSIVENIISNSIFDDELNNWSGNGCAIRLHDSVSHKSIQPKSGRFFASATKRVKSWNGIQQEITGKVKRKLAYEAEAVVRIYGNSVHSADVEATLEVQNSDNRMEYISIAKVTATNKDWVQMKGMFLVNGSPSRVVIYLEGPPPGIDILLDSLVVKHAAKKPPSTRPIIQNPGFGVNIIANSNLNDGIQGWDPVGDCTLSVGTGSPCNLPSIAIESHHHQPLSGRYILAQRRTEKWMGPSQKIKHKVKLHLTYQVSAQVRIGHGATSPQSVKVTFKVDNKWVDRGEVEIRDNTWHEIAGSFRIEEQPSELMVYVHGPDKGIDLMVAGLQICPVDRQVRFDFLKRQTDQVRKCDVVLKISGLDPGTSFVSVKQIQNSFPFGSCLMRTNIDNEEFVDFFVKNFNWSVFMNETKWYWTEPQRGKFNYKDANELLNFCSKHNINVRGHCIFWEVGSHVQQWLRDLDKKDLRKAIEKRLKDFLEQYKGKFKHYDVTNEMMHGSFYRDKLGEDARANMFMTAQQLDPNAILFVNDYHVEDGCDSRSSPEKYIQHMEDLKKCGAPVGGIGIQGHIDCPIGAVVRSALDKLAELQLPIWFTEVEVVSSNEYIRADDLEVMLREAFAHPAVEGIMFWGFWELFTDRTNSHLVNAEGGLNEAGRRYLDLREEWKSQAEWRINKHVQGEQFSFRGFHGLYELEINSPKRKITRTFIVNKDQEPLVITINL